jgi:hypothetical protein
MKIRIITVFLFIVFIVLGFTFLSSVVFAVPQPVASYSFNENQGIVVDDSSGNNNNGSAINTAWDLNGKYGSALSFNGTDSIVSINNSSSLNLTTGMTLEAWIKPASLSKWKNVITKERPNHLVYGMYANTNTNRPSGEISIGGSNTTIQGNSQLPVNAWTHIAVTFDGSNLQIFVNGTQVAAQSVSGSITTSANPLRIGGNLVWGEYFSGFIDEVRIYNVALSASDIQTDMNTPINPLPTPIPTPTLTPAPTLILTPTATPTSTPTPTGTTNPNRPDHTVIVIEENRTLQDVLGVGYFTQLANEGALMVQSFAPFHPSQPNYFQFFAGSSLGVTDNTCPPTGSPFGADNLGNQLLTRGFTFTGYAESLPSNTLPCIQLPYVGHHVPWLYFSNVPLSSTKNMTQFPTDYTMLPTVSIIIPNNVNNAHDGTVAQASTWLQQNLDGYKQWAMTHKSLLIVHFDEDDSSANNQIYTVFVGSMVKKGI